MVTFKDKLSELLKLNLKPDLKPKLLLADKKKKEGQLLLLCLCGQ